MIDLTLVVMAAGIGRRYGGLKQVDPIGPGGEIILDYSIFDALQAGFTRFVFVVSAQTGSVLQERIGRTFGREFDVSYLVQELNDLPEGFNSPSGRRKPWGTGHAVLCCRRLIEMPFAVINADDFYGRAAYERLATFLRQLDDEASPPLYGLVIYRLENTISEHGHVARAVCTLDDHGRLLRVQERTRITKVGGQIGYIGPDDAWVPLPGETPVSLNFWGVTPAIFPELRTLFAQFLSRSREHLHDAEFYFPDAMNSLIETKRAAVQSLTTEDRWYGVTYQADKFRVREAISRLVRAGVYPESLWG